MTALLSRSEREAGRARQPPTDREAALLGTPMPGDRLRALLVTVVLGVIGAAVRLQNLGTPTDKGTPVFDEKHYVPQAWQMLRNGGYEDNYGYELVVHPPLAKQLIAVGEWLFGYNAWGWRFSAAVAGALIIVLTIRIARRLTRSTLLGAIAGILVICDGVLHLQSRMGMLDIFLALFVLAAFATLLRDRDQVRERLAVAVRQGWADESPFGPRLGFRWWRFGTGVLLGLATAVKWSGMYWVLAFGLLCLVFDAMARRTAGVPRPWAGMLRRDLAPALWGVGVIAVLVYLSSWWAWFASETATDRHYVELQQVGDGPFGFVPAALRSLVLYTLNVLEFHESLSTPSGDRTRGSRSPGRGRWACARCSTPTSRGRRSPAAASRSVSRRRCSSARPPCGGWRCRCWPGRCGARSSAPTGATRRCSSATVRACCPGSSTSTGRCTSSTPPRWRRSWCSG